MTAIAHPLKTAAGRKEFLFGRLFGVLGLLIVSGGLLLLAIDSLLPAVVLLTAGAAVYIVGTAALRRSWQHVPAGQTRGHEPVWMFVTGWFLSTFPIAFSLWVLADSGLANAAVTAVVTVALLTDAVAALRDASAHSAFEKALDISQGLIWLVVLARAVISFIPG